MGNQARTWEDCLFGLRASNGWRRAGRKPGRSATGSPPVASNATRTASRSHESSRVDRGVIVTPFTGRKTTGTDGADVIGHLNGSTGSSAHASTTLGGTASGNASIGFSTYDTTDTAGTTAARASTGS